MEILPDRRLLKLDQDLGQKKTVADPVLADRVIPRLYRRVGGIQIFLEPLIADYWHHRGANRHQQHSR